MKTAISLPDDLFASAEALAERMGISRSHLVATALAEFVAKHQSRKVTAPAGRPLHDGVQRARTRPPGAAQTRAVSTDAWVIERGTIWWADLRQPRGSEPGFRRPVLIVQADAFNRSRIQTLITVVLSSDTFRLLDAPGNVLVPATLSGLPKDSVANVSQVVTLDRGDLQENAGRLDSPTLRQVEAGLRLVLHL